MNVTQEKSPCFNKLLPICSTPKNPNGQLSDNSIQMASPIEISHSENAVNVNIVTSLNDPKKFQTSLLISIVQMRNKEGKRRKC